MLKKLIKLFSSSHYIYKFLLICFACLFLGKQISIPYIAIILVFLTYIICNKLKINLDTDIYFLKLFKYLLFLFKEIVISSFNVARIIWSRNLKITPSFGLIKTENNTDLGVTILSNSITLTPGTITISIDGQNILIHALEEKLIKELENSKIDIKIKNICA